jgi:RND family efflux transporter MFP subunit
MKSRFLVLVLASAVFFSACSIEEKKVEQKTIKSVFAIYPKSKDGETTRVFNALASANNQVKLSFKVKGNIRKLELDIGDEVKKNQLIASLDSAPYELQVSQAKFGLSEATVAMKNAKSNYERVKKLYINQNASTSDIDNAKAQYNSTKAKVNNIQKQLDYIKLQLSYTKLYSPIDGYISSKFVQENENVNAGTPIVLISDKLVDEVQVQVPDVLINKLKVGDSVKVKFTSISNDKFDAKIKEISKFTSPNQKTYQVVLKLENPTKKIKSGMSCEVYFNLLKDLKSVVYLIPAGSVLNDKNGYFVYVLEKQDDIYQIKRKNVKVGNLTNDGYEIISGIKDKDLVLKAGMSEVFENMEVSLGNKKELGK